MNTEAPGYGQERRSNPRVRALFDEALALLAPFADPANRWAGQSLDHLAYRTLRDHLPALPPDDARILVEAVLRRLQTAAVTQPITKAGS